jgi:NADPH-dependent curcumin reductase CurA
MTNIESREIRLASRPGSRPSTENFTVATVKLGPLKDGHVLVRNRYLSIEPCVFCRIRGGKSHLPTFEVGATLEGGAVGTVFESKSDDFNAGDVVISNYGWREWYTASADNLRTTSRPNKTLNAYLGLLGLQRICPWACSYLTDLKPASVMIVSGRVGVQGSLASHLAQLRDCHVIGPAGSRDMVVFMRDECGFDIAFDYKEGSVFEQLGQADSFANADDDPALEAALGICMAGSFVAKATPGARGNGPNMPLPVFFLSQADVPRR